jgi:hypothetical protein
MLKEKFNLSSEVAVMDQFIIANSKTVTIGDAVELAAGLVDLCDSSSTAVLGVVVALVNVDGTPLTHNGAGAGFTNTFTTASDNATVAQVKAIVNTSKDAVYEVALDAAKGTTTGSDVIGALFDFASETTLDESSVGAGGLMQVIGFHPTSTTKVFAKINISAIR